MCCSPPARTCVRCGEQFHTFRANKLYCSSKCSEAERYARTRQPARRVHACRQCSASLDSRSRKAEFCSGKCSNDFHNARRAAEAHAVMVANRQPCKGCAGPIPADRRSTAEYCSNPCKTRSRRHEAYGLTNGELQMLLDQHEVCAICNTDDWGKKGPQVDHCHDTGAVRGVLCINCNVGMGNFQDDLARLESAAAYLRRSRA